MTTWVDLFVYAALIVAVWGGLPGWSAFTIRMVADRNSDWLADHPDVEQRLGRARWFRRSCRVCGTLSLAALLAVQFGVWPQRGAQRWEVLKDLNSALLIGGLTVVFGCLFLFERWLKSNVPLAARRQATLVPRSVDDYVPRLLQYAVYGVVMLHLAVWLTLGVAGRFVTAGFWGDVAFQVLMSGVFLLFVVGAVRRKPGVVDRISGPNYRRIEVRMAFAIQLLPLLNGAARLNEHMGYVTPDSLDRILHLGLVGFVGIHAAMVTVWSRQPPDKGRSLSAHAATAPPLA